MFGRLSHEFNGCCWFTVSTSSWLPQNMKSRRRKLCKVMIARTIVVAFSGPTSMALRSTRHFCAIMPKTCEHRHLFILTKINTEHFKLSSQNKCLYINFYYSYPVSFVGQEYQVGFQDLPTVVL